jgi:hypothetical protein
MQHASATSNKYVFLRKFVHRQSYLNLLYLLASFPLGVFYFVFLAAGISTGLSLVIVWLGLPLLLFVGAAWWALANFERLMAIVMLKEDIPPMYTINDRGENMWKQLKLHLANPVTWKSLVYLFLKFPLGLVNFVVLVILLSLTAALISMPFTYQSAQFFPAGIHFGFGLPAWHIDSLGEALLGMLIGFVLWPATLYISDGLAWVQAKLARLMLGNLPRAA